MKGYLVKRNEVWQFEARTSPPLEEHILANIDVPYIDCYTIFQDEDGTPVALVSERKLADKMNQLSREEYERSKQR